MQTETLKTQEAPCKWFAAQDARMRSIVNATHYTLAQRTRAERMRLALEMVYSARGVHVAYGRRGISVKVDGAQVNDCYNLALLEQEWAAKGVTKRVSAQGVIYRFC